MSVRKRTRNGEAVNGKSQHIENVGPNFCILKYYNVCTNHDPVMTLTYFKARSMMVAYVFEWVNCLTLHKAWHLFYGT